MGRKLCFILCFCCVIFSACATNVPKNQESETKKEVAQATSHIFTKDTMPRIDGSTATIPLSEGLAVALLAMTEEEAAQYVKHNTTHEAYTNLFDGNCDIIFVTPPSEEEEWYAAEEGFEFEAIPVVNDAFVFLNNDKNKVDNLALDDIRKIYRGEITSWQEVGGENIPIMAYQRPTNSGSQTLFHKLILPQGEAMKPPTELAVETMMGLIEKVSDYEAGEGALGYSVYYYAKEMYPGDHSKLLAVDGVLPSEDSISSGTYPLNSPYYAVIRKDSPEDSPQRRLITYLLSEEGQRIARESGYVPLYPIK